MWQTIRIRDFGKVVTGKTPSSRNPEHFGEIYPFITPSDMDYGRRVLTERRVSEGGAEQHRNQMLPRHAVCFVCIGATIGKICITFERSLTNQQINSIIVDPARHDPFFVYYLLSTYAQKVKSRAGGAATPIVSKSIFEGIGAVAPPLATQKKIAAILSAYDDLIENNERRIRILEAMAQNLYREWFVKFRFPPLRSDGSYAGQAGHEKVKLVDSPLGKIPQGWEVGKLDDVVKNLRNATHSGDHLQNRRYVPIDCIGKKMLTLSQYEPWQNAQSSLILFEKGDILFGAMRPYFHKVAVSPCAGVTRTTCLVLRPRNAVFAGYADYLLFQEETVAYATAHSKGATIPYTAWDGTMSEMAVVIPEIGVARNFNGIALPVLQLSAGLAAKNTILRQTRDLLLPQLISSEVDVSELDIRIPEDAA